MLGMLFMATVTRGQMSWMPVRWGKCYNTQQCRTTEADDSKPQSGQESKLPATFLILNDTLKKTKKTDSIVKVTFLKMFKTSCQQLAGDGNNVLPWFMSLVGVLCVF